MLRQHSLFQNPLNEKVDIPQRLQNALDYVLNVCVLGANNKINDFLKTNGWVYFYRNRYNVEGNYVKQNGEELTRQDIYSNLVFDQESKEVTHHIKKWYYRYDPTENPQRRKIELNCRFAKKNPLTDLRFKLTKKQIEVLRIALFAYEKRQGNCGERSALLLKYLWEHSSGIDRIEYVKTVSFDHALVFVNRCFSSDLHDSDTWGEACWVVDGWFGDKGIIFHAKDFKAKIKEIKEFALLQTREFKGIMEVGRYNDNEQVLDPSSIQEIVPTRDLYPTYSTCPFLPIEYYYYTSNSYTDDLVKGTNAKPLLQSQEQHKTAFKSTLDCIAKRRSL
jgi:hypothetical protein